MAEERDDDIDWDAAWLDELDRRAEASAVEPERLEDWHVVRDRLLAELKRRT
jgi:hypothetical protein